MADQQSAWDPSHETAAAGSHPPGGVEEEKEGPAECRSVAVLPPITIIAAIAWASIHVAPCASAWADHSLCVWQEVARGQFTEVAQRPTSAAGKMGGPDYYEVGDHGALLGSGDLGPRR